MSHSINSALSYSQVPSHFETFMITANDNDRAYIAINALHERFVETPIIMYDMRDGAFITIDSRDILAFASAVLNK